MADALKSWMMVLVTLVFVILYSAALLGKVKPLSDVSMVTRLEPIIFVIIGYYFGRLPAQQNEKTLKDEIIRQTQKADGAQQVKEQALQAREVFDEKLKNAKAALMPKVSTSFMTTGTFDGASSKDEALRQRISTAVAILAS